MPQTAVITSQNYKGIENLEDRAQISWVSWLRQSCGDAELWIELLVELEASGDILHHQLLSFAPWFLEGMEIVILGSSVMTASITICDNH